jgi:predicted SAM-dependent methyltransferase
MLHLAGKAYRKGCGLIADQRRSNAETLARKNLQAFGRPYKLHAGCGTVRLSGWVNVDTQSFEGSVDVVWNFSHPFPAQDASCSHIYNEHLLEHLTVEQGVEFLRDCRRLLESGGVLRIAMPSLEYLVSRYFAGNWRDQAWLSYPENQSISTGAEMLNAAFRWWGHQWLYDSVELRRRLLEAGFLEVHQVPAGQSSHSDLKNLERRPDSHLVFEAIR